ncbi:MAG TPA: isoprenylcysteine carboxylmethyltransferase family protein [Burkholderiales bacterium]
MGNLWVPKTVDSGPAGDLATALVTDVLLLAVFALQHSVMARRGFKAWWTRIVPAHLERATYVLAATLALALLLWQWRPLALPAVWEVQSPAAKAVLWTLFCLGWGVLLLATFLINHFELFGLRQAWTFARGAQLPPPVFHTPLLYRYVRHPIYLGFLIAFWAAPAMTASHLLFAAGATGYILLGIWFEERDLIREFGEEYRRYRRQVGMLIPGRRNR